MKNKDKNLRFISFDYKYYIAKYFHLKLTAEIDAKNKGPKIS